ncbi:MAG: hypothetical protein RIQ56_684 [Candidatus Parcubacteria bacterium]|jgi:hypothetical protein
MVRNYRFVFYALVCALFIPYTSSAHQPVVVNEASIEVRDPEVSKAYYGKLSGEPHTYSISSTVPFVLYLNVLAPDIVGAKDDISAAIIANGDTSVPLAVLDATQARWSAWYEPFAGDLYRKGPEFKAGVGPGEYEIRVWSSNNDSPYILAVGEKEVFGLAGLPGTIGTILTLKKDFFGVAPATLALSIFGGAYAAITVLLGVAVGFATRFLSRRTKRSYHPSKNIGAWGRISRFVAAVVLIGFAMSTSWNAFFFIVSGFLLFESLSGWCFWYRQSQPAR